VIAARDRGEFIQYGKASCIHILLHACGAGAQLGTRRTAAEALAQRGYRVFATMRDISGCNAATSETLRSLAIRKGWNLDCRPTQTVIPSNTLPGNASRESFRNRGAAALSGSP
jgi:hypothetical protein